MQNLPRNDLLAIQMILFVTGIGEPLCFLRTREGTSESSRGVHPPGRIMPLFYQSVVRLHGVALCPPLARIWSLSLP